MGSIVESTWNYCNRLTPMLTLSHFSGLLLWGKALRKQRIFFNILSGSHLCLTTPSFLHQRDLAPRHIAVSALLPVEFGCFCHRSGSARPVLHRNLEISTSVSSVHVPHLVSSSAKTDTQAALMLSKSIDTNCSYFRAGFTHCCNAFMNRIQYSHRIFLSIVWLYI